MMRAPQLLLLLVFVCLTFSVTVADDGSDVDMTIAKITLLGGEVTRDDTLPGRPVTDIDFQGSKQVSDGCLDLLKDLTSLKLFFPASTSEIVDFGNPASWLNCI